MANLLLLLLRHPLRSLLFTHTLISQILLVLLKRLLLPHFPIYQSLRLQVQRAYLTAASQTFPDLTHRLPVGNVSPKRARKVVDEEVGSAYLIPGARQVSEFAQSEARTQQCVVVYAHGGGYARGEAKMYLNYMERWTRKAAQADLDLVFLSVDYPLSGKQAHPAQMKAFVKSYQFLLDQGVPSQNIIFMGDSAGGGLSILSGLELNTLNLPQPAATILISPWIDMTLTAHRGGNAAVESDYFISANDAVPALVSLFIGERAPDSPDVNPLYRRPEEIGRLSPQLILVGGAEFARSDSERWAEACHRAQLEHKLIIEWGQLHIYAVGSSFTAPSVRIKTDNSIIDWMKAHITQGKSEKIIGQ